MCGDVFGGYTDDVPEFNRREYEEGWVVKKDNMGFCSECKADLYMGEGFYLIQLDNFFQPVCFPWTMLEAI